MKHSCEFIVSVYTRMLDSAHRAQADVVLSHTTRSRPLYLDSRISATSMRLESLWLSFLRSKSFLARKPQEMRRSWGQGEPSVILSLVGPCKPQPIAEL